VLAGASSTGYTVVWDLRGKREVVALAYGGGAGTLAGQGSTGTGLAVGGRRGMSDIAWNPDNVWFNFALVCAEFLISCMLCRLRG
jgi:protein transport protein SEC31